MRVQVEPWRQWGLIPGESNKYSLSPRLCNFSTGYSRHHIGYSAAPHREVDWGGLGCLSGFWGELWEGRQLNSGYTRLHRTYSVLCCLWLETAVHPVRCGLFIHTFSLCFVCKLFFKASESGILKRWHFFWIIPNDVWKEKDLRWKFHEKDVINHIFSVLRFSLEEKYLGYTTQSVYNYTVWLYNSECQMQGSDAGI